jgi:hypothetical protein
MWSNVTLPEKIFGTKFLPCSARDMPLIVTAAHLAAIKPAA